MMSSLQNKPKHAEKINRKEVKNCPWCQ